MHFGEDDHLQISAEVWQRLLEDRCIFSALDLRMLGYILSHPDAQTTAEEIAAHFCLPADQVSALNRALSQRILRALRKPPFVDPHGAAQYWPVLFTQPAHPPDVDTHHFYWNVRPQLLKAFAQLSTESFEEPQRSSLVEGHVQARTISIYERSPLARKLCLAHYGAVCQLCGFSSEDVYGEAFQGIIHVHHKVPLQSIGESYVVDPIRDLLPLCPNCHAAVHSCKESVYTIEEVRASLQAQQQRQTPY